MKKLLDFITDPIRKVGRNAVTDIIIDYLDRHPVMIAVVSFVITAGIMTFMVVLPAIRG
jgi:hypothetical protein